MKTVITYGTFDLLHYGHIELLRKAYELADGGMVVVGLSTDQFNEIKGKRSYLPYATRERLLLDAISYVDKVIPEYCWEQKRIDIRAHDVDIFVIGDDWRGKFDGLGDLCEVIYLPRTSGVSSSLLREVIVGLARPVEVNHK